MILAVKESNLNVHDRESCYDSLSHCFLDTFFHCGAEIVRDDAADDFIYERKASAARHWRKFQPANPELAAAAGLAFIFALCLSGFLDRLKIWHARRRHGNLD